MIDVTKNICSKLVNVVVKETVAESLNEFLVKKAGKALAAGH